jgi:hypothetical protein
MLGIVCVRIGAPYRCSHNVNRHMANTDVNPRLLQWDYYRGRLSATFLVHGYRVDVTRSSTLASHVADVSLSEGCLEDP